jgi:hypothetical protein
VNSAQFPSSFSQYPPVTYLFVGQVAEVIAPVVAPTDADAGVVNGVVAQTMLVLVNPGSPCRPSLP